VKNSYLPSDLPDSSFIKSHTFFVYSLILILVNHNTFFWQNLLLSGKFFDSYYNNLYFFHKVVMKAVQFKLTQMKVLNFLTTAAAATTNIHLFISSS
jgi:hypothetical protein